MSNRSRSSEPADAPEIRRLRRMLKTLWPVIQGCVAVSRRPCVNRKRCRKCRSGERHPAVYFMFRRGKEARNIYLPASLIPEVKRAVENGRKLSEAIALASVSWVNAQKQKPPARR